MSHLNTVVQLCLSNVYSISKLPCAAPPSADSADGRQFSQSITCASAVAGRRHHFKEMDQGDRLLDWVLWIKMSYNH